MPSYLDVDAVVDAARRTGAVAIHPGYGFLSERAEFARAVEKAGLTLVGPSADVMEQMGRKDAARTLAVEAGVPVVPSWPHHDAGTAPDDAVFPVLVKAAAGGGGKGMRIVRSAEEYADAVAAARRESLAAFGDDTLLVEKYVESGRHIEVQVLADAHGHVVHLFERDCSTQRRHQKVLEEAPAPTITAETRELVTRSAVAMAGRVGYENAGTVEFLLDNATGEAYFLEMNTRLQVEHPVTELSVEIGGERPDLVELQLRVAAGEPLPFTQDDVRQRGHAIEARVYAEDSFGGFLPQAGTASLVRWSTNARVDHALESGQAVSTAYDPMLGKVISHGPDRESARRALLAALDETGILGLTTNIGFLRALVASEEFRDATIDTAWLDTAVLERPSADVARLAVAWVSAMLGQSGEPHPFQADGWRSGGRPGAVRRRARPHGPRRPCRRPGRRPRGPPGLRGGPRARPRGRRQPRGVGRERPAAHARGDPPRSAVRLRDDLIRSETTDRSRATAPCSLRCPGTVLAVDVTEGEAVVEGQRLGVLEAMKMELSLKAPFDGTVAAVGAATGDQVQLGQLLFEVEAKVDG